MSACRLSLANGSVPLLSSHLTCCVVLLGLAAAGCGGGATPPAPDTEPDKVSQAEVVTEAVQPAAEITLDLVDHEGLLELQKTFGNEVLCLSLSFDFEGIGEVEEVVPRVRGFLEKVGATIPNMLSKEESDVMLTKLDLVSVPGIFVYSPDGSLAKRFDDDMASTELGRAFTYADVEAEVRTLLGK